MKRRVARVGRAAVAGWVLATLALGCSARSALVEDTEPEPASETTPPDATGRCRSVCDCIDGAAVFVLGEPGTNGKCFNACDGACGPGGGVENALSTLDDLGALPHCSEICARIDALGCGVTCAELIGACRAVDPSTCPATSEQSLACVATTATATCTQGGVRFDGCAVDGVAVCGGG